LRACQIAVLGLLLSGCTIGERLEEPDAQVDLISPDASVPADVGATRDAAAAADTASPPDAESPADAHSVPGPDASAADTGPARPKLGDVDSQGRILTWADEFDGPDIDRTVWGNETGMVRNNERQCYTTDPKNQFIQGGALIVRGLPESACGGTFTSASLTTEGKQSFQYGRLEALIKVPAAKGSWPAFWLLPAHKEKYNPWWPAGGEIDIMEVVSQTPKTVYGTAHFQRGGQHASDGGNLALADDLSAAYHVYAIEWTDTRIDWFIDQSKYHSFDTTGDFDGYHPFQDSFYVILNYAIGGAWPESAGEVPDPTQYPDQMAVDWVRYWK
jgi:beta-glucanase (GH16 family)